MKQVQLKHTPFHAQVAILNHSHEWRRWAGYLVPSKYDLTHEREYHAIRSAAALIDVSPLYKYSVTGPDAAQLLNRVLTRDITRCAIGQVVYAAWCDEAGKVIEDGTVARLAEDTFRVATAEPNLRWFTDNALGLNVAVRNESESLGVLALQGPSSREILRQATEGDVGRLAFYRLTMAHIAGCPVEISRTGYTGDLGYEIWVRPEDAEVVWEALMTSGAGYGITPTGMLALDMARIEAGLLLVDVDYTPANKAVIPEQTSSPYELSLGWLVEPEKQGYFVGRTALERERQQGSRWKVVGVEVSWDSLEGAYARVGLSTQVPYTAWRTSVPLYRNGREAGYATSGCFSPLLKRYIALATVEARHAAPGTELEIEITVEHMRRRALAEVVEMPFYDPERKRKRFEE